MFRVETFFWYQTREMESWLSVLEEDGKKVVDYKVTAVHPEGEPEIVIVAEVFEEA